MADALLTVKATLDAASMSSGTRNFCGEARQGTLPPYTVLSIVAEEPENTLSSGVIKRNARVQIDGYAREYVDLAEAGGLIEEIRDAMEAAAFTNAELMAQTMHDPDVNLHRVVMDYSIWF